MKQKTQDLSISELKKYFWERVTASDWEDKYYPNHIAKTIAIESADLLRIFQWTDSIESWQKIEVESEKSLAAAKIIEILAYTIMLAELIDVDIVEIIKKSHNSAS